MSFVPHMSFVEAHKLQIGDKVDHRNVYGKFVMATITHKSKSGMFKIHYDDHISSTHDTQCSYVNELYRFAKVGSISRRPAHRLKYIKTGSFVDINIAQHPGWRKAEVVTVCPLSGQIQVQYLLDISEGITKPMKWIRWVHLDNTLEVSRFGVHTYTKEINHVAISLETNRSYQNTPTEIKAICATECIDKVFGGMNNILSFLIQNGSPSELQQIQQIIKDETIKHYDQNSNKPTSISTEIASNFTDERVINDGETASLSDLSRDSIMHICGFLNREDIKSFKLTSYRNGIACLSEMTKCNVGVSNVNEIIGDMDNKYNDELGMIIRKNYKYNRYSANMDYLSLRLEWKNKFNIPLHQQLLLSENQTACRFYDTLKNDKMADFKIRAIPTPKFLLFDKRNLIKFDENTSKPKEIIPLQFVMGNHNEMSIGKLTQYLEHEFIATTNSQKQWHGKLMKYFEKMDKIDANHPKLICFKEYRNKVSFANNINEVVPWWQVIIFQLNITHPAFAKYKFTTISEKYNLLKSFQ